MTVGAKQWVVVFGNPIDGLSFHGPFVDTACACDYADNVRDQHGEFGEYWIAPIEVLPHTAWTYIS